MYETHVKKWHINMLMVQPHWGGGPPPHKPMLGKSGWLVDIVMTLLMNKFASIVL